MRKFCMLFFFVFAIAIQGIATSSSVQKDGIPSQNKIYGFSLIKKAPAAEQIKVVGKIIFTKKGKKVRGLNSYLVYISCNSCSKISFAVKELFYSSAYHFSENLFTSNHKRGPPSF